MSGGPDVLLYVATSLRSQELPGWIGGEAGVPPANLWIAARPAARFGDARPGDTKAAVASYELAYLLTPSLDVAIQAQIDGMGEA